ncbi:MAG: hypothetical protein ACP5IE_01825 [Infirmifilum sp.]
MLSRLKSKSIAIYILMGSVASGKTTLAKKLISEVNGRGHLGRYMHININHGLAYLITRLLVFLTKYRYVGNHYLTLRFNNPGLFCKYLILMILLDAFYAPIKLLKLLIFKLHSILSGRKYVIVIDEYYFNAIIDYTYFLRHLCKNKSKRASYAIRFLFLLSLRFLHMMNANINIVFLETDLIKSVKGWIRREKRAIFDVCHLKFRTAGSRVIVQMFISSRSTMNIKVIRGTINKLPRDLLVLLSKILSEI